MFCPCPPRVSDPGAHAVRCAQEALLVVHTADVGHEGVFGESVVAQSAEVGHLDVLTELRLEGRRAVPAILDVPRPVQDVQDSLVLENAVMLQKLFSGQRSNLRRQLPGEKLQVLLDRSL